MAGARVVAMTMGDDGAVDGGMGIDEELAGLAIKPAFGGVNPGLGMWCQHAGALQDSTTITRQQLNGPLTASLESEREVGRFEKAIRGGGN